MKGCAKKSVSPKIVRQPMFKLFVVFCVLVGSVVSICPVAYVGFPETPTVGLLNPTPPFNIISTIGIAGVPTIIRNNPNGKALYTALHNQLGLSIISSDFLTTNDHMTVGAESQPFVDIAISQDGSMGFLVGGSGLIHQMDIYIDGVSILISSSTNVSATSATISPDNVLLVYTTLSSVVFWNISSSTIINTIPATFPTTPRVVWDGTFEDLVYVIDNSNGPVNFIRSFYYNSTSFVGSLPSPPNMLFYDMEIVPNNTQLIVSLFNNSGPEGAMIIDLDTLTPIRSIVTGNNFVASSGIAVTQDGTLGFLRNGALNNPEPFSVIDMSTNTIIGTVGTTGPLPNYNIRGGVAANSCHGIARCKPGSFVASMSRAVCTTCSPGTYSNTKNAPNCTDCPPGTVTDQYNSSSCQSCNPGFYSPIFGGRQCTPCWPGSFCQTSNCSMCTLCPTGSSSTSGQSVCQPCGFGTSTNGMIGQPNCPQCSLGTFSNTTGLSVCYNCLAGSFTAFLGTDCLPCFPGTFNFIANSPICQICPSGQYQPNSGGASCLSCPAGSYTPNSTTCIHCPPGTVAPTGANVGPCRPCGEGFETTDRIGCVPCPVNISTNISGGVFTCSINCSTIVVSGISQVSSGAGGPCFDPSNLNISTTIPVPVPSPSSNNQSDNLWAWILLPLITILLLAAVLALIFNSQQDDYTYFKRM